MYQGNWPVPRSQWAVEVRKFLDTRPRDTIEAQVPADLDVHLIVDNYATHKTASSGIVLEDGLFAQALKFCKRFFFGPVFEILDTGALARSH